MGDSWGDSQIDRGLIQRLQTAGIPTLMTRQPGVIMRPIELLVPTQAGLHCPSGAFYIDPIRPVARALVTHAHSDHARSGHKAVLATAETLDLMRLRYGKDFAGTTQAVGYGETV